MVAPTVVSKGQLALNSLRNAEESALANSDASGAEDGGSFYTGKGKSNAKLKKKGARGKIAGLMLVLMLTGGGVFLSTTNSTLGPAIEALVTQQADTQYPAANRRMTYLMRTTIQGDAGITVKEYKGAKKYGKISGKFKKRLAAQGITMEGQGKNAKLVYTVDYINDDGVPAKKSTTIPADEFRKTYNNNRDFQEAFQTARRGRIATFFDNTATKVLKKTWDFT